MTILCYSQIVFARLSISTSAFRPPLSYFWSAVQSDKDEFQPEGFNQHDQHFRWKP